MTWVLFSTKYEEKKKQLKIKIAVDSKVVYNGSLSSAILH